MRERHIVSNCPDSTRLEAYCVGLITGISSRKGIKKAIKRGEVLLNGEANCGSKFICNGDEIVWVEHETSRPFKIFPLKLHVILEDDHIAVIQKPAGYPVSGNYYKTIEHALPFNLSPSSQHDALGYPLPCHRLDAATSGCVLVAKTHSARVHIGRQFEQGQITKIYHALVVGEGIVNQVINHPIEGKESLSELELICSVPSLSNKCVSLVKLIPHTGRTHQLRIHCAEIGFPILGDPLYGEPLALLKGKGLFLASTSIGFVHPHSSVYQLATLEIPLKFQSFLDREARRYYANH